MARKFSRSTLRNRHLTVEHLEPRALLAATDLRITELMASNDGALFDVDGDASDWLEIYNSGATPVSLAGLRLTDNASNKTKWTFPAGSGTIDPGGYRVVFASSKNGIRGGGEIHTSFALSAGGEYLGLIDADGVTVIDAYTPEFPPQVQDVSYGRAMAAAPTSTTIIATGAQARAWVPTGSQYDASWRTTGFNSNLFPLAGPTGFGYENNPGDAVNFTAEIGTAVPNTTRSLYMRVPFNLATLTGIDRLTLRMRYDDGFVAYVNGERVAEANAPETVQWNSAANNGNRADSLAEQFVEYDISSVIPKLVAGQNVLAIHGLNSPGSDMLISPELVARGATIITPAELGYFDIPTPGYGNGADTFAGFAGQVQYSVPHGFYTTPQTVSLSSATPGAVIVYTTNGSTPTVNGSLVPTNGTLYTGPINVSATTVIRATAFKADFRPSFVAPSSYIFLNDVINQSPTGTPPAGWPANGAVNDQQMNYGIDPDIIALYGAQAVKDSLASLPTFSISTDLTNLFDPQTGIYVNAVNDGREWERPTSVELINPDGSPGFSTNAGLRIRGGYSRNDFNPKHAFRLYFRGEYGDGKLNYPLFGAEGTDEFDVIDLRTEQNYSWSSSGNVQNTFLREVFSRDLQADLGDQYTRSRYYHLYVGGQYFGVFMTQERVQEDYAATYFGGAPEDYDILKAGLADGGMTQLAEGNDAAWLQLYTLAENLATNPAANINNYWTMQGLNPDGTRNPALPVLLDVDNLVNYMLIIFYTGGYDTGISRFLGDNQANNWYGVYNRVTADQGFQFFIHDNEHSLGAEDGAVHGTQFIDRTGPFNLGNQNQYSQFNPVYLHQDLLAHPLYRQAIIEKTHQFFFNNGPMTSATSVARLQERMVQVEPAIIAEAARWGDSVSATPLNKSTWQTEVNWLANVYFPGRTNTVLQQLRLDVLYVARPQFSVPAGQIAAGTLVSMSAPGNPAGIIYYTTDGVTDPRLPDGAVSASSEVKIYSSPIVVSSDMTIRARMRLNSGVWSPLSQTVYDAFVPGDYDGDLRTNGNDFLAWQRQLGSAASPLGAGADGNRNGVVDAADLSTWKNSFGNGGDPLAAESAALASMAAADAFTWPSSVFFGGMLAATTAPGGQEDPRVVVDLAYSGGEVWRVRVADPPYSPRPRVAFRPPSPATVRDESTAAAVADTLDAALADIL